MQKKNQLPFLMQERHIGGMQTFLTYLYFPICPILFILRFAIIGVVCIVGLILLIPSIYTKHLQSNRFLMVYTRCIIKLCLTLILGAMGIIVIQKNKPHQMPKILVSNHISNVDILVYLWSLNCTFLSKIEISRTFFLKTMAYLLDVVYVDRSKKGLDFDTVIAQRYNVQLNQKFQQSKLNSNELMDVKQNDSTNSGSQTKVVLTTPQLTNKDQKQETQIKRKPMLVFPEGTTSNGFQIFKFKNGAFRFNTQVQSIVIQYKSLFPVSAVYEGLGHVCRVICNPITIVKIQYLCQLNNESFSSANEFAQAANEQIQQHIGCSPARYAIEDFLYFFRNGQHGDLMQQDFPWMGRFNKYKDMCIKVHKDPFVQWDEQVVNIQIDK